MPNWTLLGFDWTRYRRLAPRLKEALDRGDLRSVRDEDASDLLASLEHMPGPAEACNYVITELCTTANAVACGSKLPEFLIYLKRFDGGQEAVDILLEAVFSGAGVEPWFQCEEGLVGFLPWTNVDHLVSHLNVCVRTLPPLHASRVVRAIGRRRSELQKRELLNDLLVLVTECRQNRWGLAVHMTDR